MNWGYDHWKVLHSHVETLCDVWGEYSTTYDLVAVYMMVSNMMPCTCIYSNVHVSAISIVQERAGRRRPWHHRSDGPWSSSVAGDQDRVHTAAGPICPCWWTEPVARATVLWQRKGQVHQTTCLSQQAYLQTRGDYGCMYCGCGSEDSWSIKTL